MTSSHGRVIIISNDYNLDKELTEAVERWTHYFIYELNKKGEASSLDPEIHLIKPTRNGVLIGGTEVLWSAINILGVFPELENYKDNTLKAILDLIKSHYSHEKIPFVEFGKEVREELTYCRDQRLNRAAYEKIFYGDQSKLIYSKLESIMDPLRSRLSLVSRMMVG